MPYFSVILPIYNVEDYLERCINVIINEKFKDYELILVDDGSTDKCPVICDDYARKYPFISVVHKKNGGLSSARNAGLEVATGKYLFWIDSDDWIMEGTLEKLYSATHTLEPDIVKFNFMSNPRGDISISSLKPGLYTRQQIENEVVPLALEDTGNIIFSIWSHLYKTSFIRNNRLLFVSEREIGSEDYLFNFESYSCAETILALEDVLYIYDYREGSLSHRKRAQLSDQYKKLHNMMLDYARRNAIYEKYKDSLAYSYVNKTFCIRMRNECYLSDTNKFWDAYKMCTEILHEKELRDAVNDYPVKRVRGIEKRNYLFVKYKMTMLLMVMLLRGLRQQGQI